MGTRDPRIDAYIEAAAPFARPVLTHLRDVVHRACPEVVETWKWSFPHFEDRGLLCSMAAFRGHCAFGFRKGALVVGDDARSDAMGQFGRIATLDDLPSPEALEALVRRAAALNEAGMAAPRSTTRRAAPEVPDALLAALRARPEAMQRWSALPPSHRREYAEWVAGARTEATRARRVATSVEWIAEGLGRNWKYQRPR
jgi:hypothetical protein